MICSFVRTRKTARSDGTDLIVRQVNQRSVSSQRQVGGADGRDGVV